MRRVALLVALALGAIAYAASAAPAHGGPTAGQAAPRAGPVTHGPDRVSAFAAKARPRVRAARLADWCGGEASQDESQNEVDNGDQRFHAIYAVPTDAPARLDEVAPRIQEDALMASRLLASRRGREIRYDMGTSCGATHLDITTVRIPVPSAVFGALAGTRRGTLDTVIDTLADTGLTVARGDTPPPPTNRNYIVWLDAPGAAGACGQATFYDDSRRTASNLNNLGGKVALIYRHEDGIFCGPLNIIHEVAHTLGAVQHAAPNAFDWHCNDAAEDVLCDGGPSVGGDFTIDHGSDDYWDPPGGQLPWWTVNQSSFLCEPGCNGSGPQASRARKHRTKGCRARGSGARAQRARARCRKRKAAARRRSGARAAVSPPAA